MIKLFKIKGDSLFPIYKDGDIVLAFTAKFFFFKIGDIIVFDQEDNGKMIKIISHKKNKENTYFLIGTNPYSIDSRNFGSIKREYITHKVLFRIF